MVLIVGALIIVFIVYVLLQPPSPVPRTKAAASSRGRTTVVNGVMCKEDEEYYYIETDETEVCPFCKSVKIFSGSWTNEYCENCGASHMLGGWSKEGVWLKRKE